MPEDKTFKHRGPACPAIKISQSGAADLQGQEEQAEVRGYEMPFKVNSVVYHHRCYIYCDLSSLEIISRISVRVQDPGYTFLVEPYYYLLLTYNFYTSNPIRSSIAYT